MTNHSSVIPYSPSLEVGVLGVLLSEGREVQSGLGLDHILIANRIIPLVKEGGVQEPTETMHSLALMCTYGDPFKLYPEIEQCPNGDMLQGNGVDILGEDTQVGELLKTLRGKEGIISLVINKESEIEMDGKYQLMYSGIDLPSGRWKDIMKYYDVKTKQELLDKLGFSEMGTRAKAMFNFSIAYPSTGDNPVWFLKVNGKEHYFIQDGKKYAVPIKCNS